MSATTAPGGIPAPAELHLTGISKSFGGTAALADVDFTVRRGEVHALLGGNGSGKSTLIKVMAGVYQGDAGTVTVGTREVSARHNNPTWAYAAGLRFVHQDTGVFLDHTVAENFALGSTYGGPAFGRVPWKALNERVTQTLRRFDLDVDPTARMGSLRKSDQTLVAVARALDTTGESSVLVLDEPTASLPQPEVAQVHAAIRRYVEQGHTVVLVSHRVDDVLAVADRATFLRDGRTAGTRPVAGLDERVIIAEMAGAEQGEALTRRPPPPADAPVVLDIRGLAAGDAKEVTFDLRAGEIVGLAGLAGSGQSAILQAIAGLVPRQRGDLVLDGRELAAGTAPDQVIRRGVVYVPEDRKGDAAFMDRPVQENYVMPRIGSFWSRWRLSQSHERTATERAIARYDVRPPRAGAIFSTLSGGNQQKVIMARWLDLDPRVVLLDEPTQGVDVAARSALHDVIRSVADQGVGVIVASSDPRELVALCDRVLGLVDGAVGVELRGDDITLHAVSEAAHGLVPATTGAPRTDEDGELS